ncbi:hypothetical protein G7Y89_g12734 [Cudoniella acicularis]|uniref:Uncharacterized protein n=1 Tax=Cudoniella acicularis TaxID=354080 RepID=A0A8H4RB92_9HELO|nr:hypothetical protein G7Y89_g12734 [Cudoniella acicularis]
MALSIGFSAGPFAQVGINILSWETVYHHAVNAYGWYKASERSQSLVKVFSVNGAQLVASSSFDTNAYIENRKNGQVHGVLVQEGRVQTTVLPNASTAITEDRGLLCLRALTTAVLCLYTPGDTVTILAEVIPSTLMRLDDYNSEFIIEGPLRSVLQQYVKDVACEEGSNTFRSHLMGKLKEHQLELTGATLSDIMACDPNHPFYTRHNDIQLVLGAVQWMLFPVHNRPIVQYPTRSLRVWSLAAIMMEIGFEISAHYEVLSSQESYENFCQTPLRYGRYPAVALVTRSSGPTDRTSFGKFSSGEHFNLRPRIIALRGTPWEAFRHFRGNSGKGNTQYLVDVWEFAFKRARDSVSGISILDGSIHIEIQSFQDEVNNEFHRSLLRQFSPHLSKVCGQSMKEWIQPCPSAEWNEDVMSEELKTLELNERLSEAPKDQRISDPTLMVVSIVLGTTYGIISTSCKDDGNNMTLASDVVFRPDIFYEQRRLRGWASGVGIAISGNMPYRHWNDLILEVVLGLGSENAYLSSTLQNRNRNLDMIMNLGAQANGMVAILGMILEPSITSDKLFLVHIGRGQILNFPLTEDGYIQSYDRIERASSISEDDQNDLSELEFPNFSQCDKSTRVDVEPAWEADFRRVLFRVRHNGILIASPNIPTVVSYLVKYQVPCSCSKRRSMDLQVFAKDGWQYIKAEKLIQNSLKRLSYRTDFGKKDQRYLLDGSGSMELTMYCLGAMLSSNVAITTTCLACAYDRVMKREGHAILILSALMKDVT